MVWPILIRLESKKLKCRPSQGYPQTLANSLNPTKQVSRPSRRWSADFRRRPESNKTNEQAVAKLFRVFPVLKNHLKANKRVISYASTSFEKSNISPSVHAAGAGSKYVSTFSLNTLNSCAFRVIAYNRAVFRASQSPLCACPAKSIPA